MHESTVYKWRQHTHSVVFCPYKRVKVRSKKRMKCYIVYVNYLFKPRVIRITFAFPAEVNDLPEGIDGVIKRRNLTEGSSSTVALPTKFP